MVSLVVVVVVIVIVGSHIFGRWWDSGIGGGHFASVVVVGLV